MRYYWYYKACTKYFPVLLRTKKLAQNTSQYYFVLQSLHKIRTSTTSYYKTCTQYFPVLLHTTKLAQNTSQYYFVLQSLHITKHNGTARGIFQTPRPRSADNGDHSSAARTQTGPVAQTKFPTSTPERSCARKHRVSFNSYPPSMDKAFEAAIPMQNANLGQQTQWRSAWNLSKITSARRWQRGPLERSTARTQTGPRAQTASTLGTTLKGENISFRSIPTPQASPAQSVRSSDSNATCKPGSPNNGTAHGIFQRSLPCSPDKTTRAQHEGKPDPSHKRGSPHRRQEPHYARKRIFSFLYTPQASPGQSVRSSHSNAKCKPGSPNTMATANGISQRSPPRSADNGDHPVERSTNANRTRRTNRVPHIDAYRRREPHYVRFLPSKHHLDAAIPLRYAITGLQVTVQLFTSLLSHPYTPCTARLNA